MSLRIELFAGMLIGLVAAALVGLVIREVAKGRLRPASDTHRILLPFTGEALSIGVLDAAIRLATAEHATLVPCYLARVPLRLPLTATLPRQGAVAVELLEAIEQRALRAEVPVDARVQRGRTAQHALQSLTDRENYYRMVLPAASGTYDGLDATAIAWALENAPGEIIVLRAGEQEQKPRRRGFWP